MKLSPVERFIVCNQLRILSRLDPTEAKRNSWLIAGIERGFEIAIDEVVGDQPSRGLTREDSRWVVEVLNMYRALNFSFRDMKDKASLSADRIRFPGFDGNHETELYSFVRWWLSDDAPTPRFEELRGPSVNSHTPMRARYEAQLTRWRTMPDKFALTAEQIEQILDAR